LVLLVLLPIPASLYLPVTIIGSVIVSIGFGFLYPIQLTFDDDFNPFGGGRRIFRDAGRMVREYGSAGLEIIDEIKRERHQSLDAGEVPVDMPCSEVLIGITMSIIGMCVILPCWIALAAIKFVPAVFRLWLILWHEYFWESFRYNDLKYLARCCCFPFFLVGNCFVPVFASFALC